MWCTPVDPRIWPGRPARTYIQQLCDDTGCNPEDLPEAMNNMETWRERIRDIRACHATWWWWWWWFISKLFKPKYHCNSCINRKLKWFVLSKDFILYKYIKVSYETDMRAWENNIYIYILQQSMVVTISPGGFMSDQMRYNLEC